MTVYQPLVPNPNWPKSFTFSPGVRVGNFIFFSGTTATDDKGVMVGKGDIVVQTRQIFRKFAAVLELAGGNLTNIVETTDYVLSLEDYQKPPRSGARFSRGLHGRQRRESWSADWFELTRSLK